MLVVRKRSEMEGLMKSFVKEQKKIGFVPTMGFLHEGHLSLIRQSLKENDLTVCSIFVNPTQFNNADDFKFYPKNEVNDTALLKANKCDVLFIPYDDFANDVIVVDYDLKGMDKILEGEFRPGHFVGVVNVVSLLFTIIPATNAYFGEKDFQQLTIVKNLAKHKFPQITIKAGKTIREESGLAMSSRNVRLSEAEKQSAIAISKALFEFKECAVAEKEVLKIKEKIIEKYFTQSGMRLEYLEVADANSLRPVKLLTKEYPVVVCVAVYVGNTRLIDNVIISY